MNKERTNFPDILYSVPIKNSLIWFIYHRRRWEIEEVKSHPLWNSVDNIFLVDQECQINHNNELDCEKRLHIWDSTISTHPRLHTYLFWFGWVRIVEEKLGLCSKLVPWYDKKCDYLFDCLLGTLRKNRRFVIEKLKNSNLSEKFIMGSQQSTMTLINGNLPTDWIVGAEGEDGTNQYKLSKEMMVNVTSLTPYQIYNQSWYSIVAENCSGNIFYTEKTGKPLLAKRLFVLFGEKHTLKHLRNFGFRTFGDVIDESYDEIDDDTIRWNRAWTQVEYLLTQDPVSIHQKILHVLEHNHNFFMKQDWYKKMCQEMQQLLTTV